jgi:FlgD Ig-like domain
LQRVLTTATLVGLLVATAAAFAITERLKLVKSPIYGTVISQIFSPTCGCARGTATLSLGFRRSDRVTLIVLTRNRTVVRTLALGLPVRRGVRVFHWDGKTDLGPRALDGRYRVQVHLEGQHRTILLPNVITLDTTPPQLLDAQPNRTQISPDGDRLGDTVTLNYVLDKPAHIVVYLHGRQIIRGRSHLLRGGVVWTGSLDGRVLKPAVVTLTMGAVDLGGNVTPVADRARVRIEIRYIKLANRHITGVAPGAIFDIGVSTDAKLYRWRLGARHGVKAGPLLRLRAPGRPGTYRLTVTERGHHDTAAVVVG